MERVEFMAEGYEFRACLGFRGKSSGLVPSLIEGLRVVQGLRVVPVFLYRYSTKNWSEKGS
jgi:hypothetical protein